MSVVDPRGVTDFVKKCFYSLLLETGRVDVYVYNRRPTDDFPKKSEGNWSCASSVEEIEREVVGAIKDSGYLHILIVPF